MNCEQCVFYSRREENPTNPPCISCAADASDKGYCVAVISEQGYVPVITRIIEESRAREIIQRGIRNGSTFQLLHWSTEKCAYLLS
jgi:hypothetical protein